MKKNLLLVCLFVASTSMLNAQNYLISFAGNEAVGSVEVQNLTQNTKLTVSAGNSLRLVATVTALGDLEADDQSGLKVYPNPMVESATVEFYVSGNGTTTLEVYDMAGRSVARYSAALGIGVHKVQLNGLGNGLYTLSMISNGKISTQKVVVKGSAANSPTISYLGSFVAGKTSNNLKSAILEQQMQFNIGDRLLMKGSSVNGAKINTVVDIPTASKTVTFALIACTDGDGNNYGTVKIGNQIWMTENLKTTRYSDGTSINLVTANTAWKSLTTPAYCYYNNDKTTYNNKYGVLYNWYVVGEGVAPVGWHVPTKLEWTILTTALGGEGIAGGAMKEVGTANWSSPNAGATNSSGFSALPGGARKPSDGSFCNLGTRGNWWTSTAGVVADAYILGLSSELDYVSPYGYYGMCGNSIRCVKD